MLQKSCGRSDCRFTMRPPGWQSQTRRGHAVAVIGGRRPCLLPTAHPARPCIVCHAIHSGEWGLYMCPQGHFSVAHDTLEPASGPQYCFPTTFSWGCFCQEKAVRKGYYSPNSGACLCTVAMLGRCSDRHPVGISDPGGESGLSSVSCGSECQHRNMAIRPKGCRQSDRHRHPVGDPAA